MRGFLVPVVSLVVALALTGCATAVEDPPSVPRLDTVSGPHVVVLGTAQDGGLPHVACDCPRCEAARHDPARRRLVASLGIVLPDSGKRFLVDATPDIRPQLDVLAGYTTTDAGRVDRRPVDGVFLTHAHLGHYTGLAFFGFEAAHTREVPVWCTPSMAAYLRSNGPWDQLVRLENVVLHEVSPGEAIDLGEGVTVTMVSAPHRKEYTDTVGFVVRGPRASVLYVPDTDSWNGWDPPIVDLLRNVDVAMLDGTFHSLDELPGRSVESIGHPLITVSMDLMEATAGAGVYFTHLNHSNPALEPDGEALRTIEARGFHVLEDGAQFPL
jgi:pyrroloquinoline quinone biosynthesis protein B